MKTDRVSKLTFVLLSLVLGFSSCRMFGPPPAEGNRDFAQEMRDSYQAAYELFGRVWAPQPLAAPEEKQKVITLLERLSKNFHGVERKAGAAAYDAGFKVALELNQELLRDSKRRLESDDTEYAVWRLRGMMHNCVACHTRYQAPITFIGDIPRIESPTLEERLAIGDFLVASRQYEQASVSLLSLAGLRGTVSSTEQPEFRALKLWLVVQLRDPKLFPMARKTLQVLIASGRYRGETGSVLKQWVADLKRFSKKSALPRTLSNARDVVDTLAEDSNILQDEQSLVRSLIAVSALNSLLPALSGAERREALYLLGIVYNRMQIRELGLFRNLFLEQCIREFPGTKEAQLSYQRYEQEISMQSTGSAGANITEEDEKKLHILRELAFGSVGN
jgi:hypothetical protein